MGKGDKKTKRGKITQGSYGKTRPRKKASAKAVPVKVRDNEDKSASIAERKKVTKSTEPTENAEVKKSVKPKMKSKESGGEEKPKTAKKKKTEE